MNIVTQALLFPAPKDLRQPSRQSLTWQPTRGAGLARLDAFLPFAGSTYASSRNTDFGPDNRTNVSALSPYLARRMITEPEVVRSVLARHSFASAEKFIQEVFWRAYWKGWLELRPQVLVDFNNDRLALKVRLANDPELAQRVSHAMSGNTGIVCFDTWVGELLGYGWLHNHARMWFASIWVFTLKLPWQLGADFFYKHLIDADAASNTLSWRWVAGLHTKGKHYLARASNIARYSAGRFDPSGQLDEAAPAISEERSIPGARALPPSLGPKTQRVGLLITEDDLHPASWQLGADILGAATFALPPLSAPQSPRALFSQGALTDARARAAQDLRCDVLALDSLEGIVNWAQSLGVTEIVTAHAPCGLIAWALDDVEQALKRQSIDLIRVRRTWDTLAWPLATGGFFKLKEKLPWLIKALACHQ
jgi:deoxyribodipyrimidine photo-lyase